MNTTIPRPAPARPPRRMATVAVTAALTLVPLAAACGSAGAGGAGSGTGAPATVTIQNFAFSPATLTVRPGQTVTVVNRDPVTHTLTSTTRAFNTGDIQAQATVTFTAPAAPGRYPYQCQIHQYMTGLLVVSRSG